MTPEYSATIKKYIISFASLFDEISYYSDDPIPKLIRPTLVYAPREKWMVKRLNKAEFDSADNSSNEVRMIYPAMAFEMLPFNYAPDRATNPQNKIISNCGDIFSMNRIPYDFQFNLYITTKKFDDSLKIIEQIVPLFSPEYSITITDNLLGAKNSIPVILNSSTYEIDYEGDFSTTRDITWTLSFTMKGFLYPPIKNISTQNPISGTVCTIGIESIPGEITFTGYGESEIACTGATIDFIFSVTGNLFPGHSILEGIFTGTRTDQTTFDIPIICEVFIKNDILYAEVSGYLNEPLNPIKGVSFTFNYPVINKTILKYSEEIFPETPDDEYIPPAIISYCRDLTGFVSCTADGKWKLIKKTIVDVTPDQSARLFDRLISQVDPFTANKTDEYEIIDSITEYYKED